MRTYSFDVDGTTVEATLNLIEDRWRVVRVSFDDQQGVETASLRRLPIARIEAMASAPAGVAVTPSDFVMKIPDRKPYPDEFYKRIAWLYRAATPTMHNPGATLAEANNVPRTTAHRWIRECRIRGYLDKGRHGAAG